MNKLDSVDTSFVDGVINSPAHELSHGAARSSIQRATRTLQASWFREIGDCLEHVNEQIERQLMVQHNSLVAMMRHVGQLGGKRFRPALLLLSSKLFGQPNEEAFKLAVVVELLHTATLLHDDVLDGASIRRTMTTVHQAYGVKCGILLGDFLFTKAYHLAATCDSNYPAQLISQCATELCEGELRQQVSVGHWEMDESTYLDILRQKTAELCATCCRLGAWTQDATDQQTDQLEKFGRNLGVAFQIMDDWLDFWGTDSVGKSLGTDLAQRKPTLPILRLLQSVEHQERSAIVTALNENSSVARQFLLNKLNHSDASAYTLGTVRRYINMAKESLAGLPMGDGLNSLKSLADQLVDRKT